MQFFNIVRNAFDSPPLHPRYVSGKEKEIEKKAKRKGTWPSPRPRHQPRSTLKTKEAGKEKEIEQEPIVLERSADDGAEGGDGATGWMGYQARKRQKEKTPEPPDTKKQASSYF